MNKEYHFIKEVREQPAVVRATLAHVRPRLPELARRYTAGIERIVLVGCGDSYFLSVAAGYAFEAWGGIQTEAIEAAEFARYRHARVDAHTLVIGISSSGKSLAVLEALERAMEKGAVTLGLTNLVPSPLAELAQESIQTQAGRSDAYPTKQTTTALAVLYALALEWAGIKRTLPQGALDALTNELVEHIPAALEQMLVQEKDLQTLAALYAKGTSYTFLGCGPNWGTALHGAAKMIETSQSLGRAANLEEFSHLYSYTLQPDEPILVLSRAGWVSEQARLLAPNLRENGGKIIAVASADEKPTWEGVCDEFITVPPHSEMFGPLVTAIPLQLFAYGVAMAKGRNPDKPERRGSDYIQQIIYGGMLDGYAER